MKWEDLDWQALARLRAVFLNHPAGGADYWQTERDLASYDQTFAQRIGWKWDHVLLELPRLGWQPPAGTVLDWGCGSGIASRAFLDHFDATHFTELRLYDRSLLALQYASRRAREKYPGLEISLGAGQARQGGTLLLSHVLNELLPEQTTKLIELAASFEAVIWVEPGDFQTSALLVGARERLRPHFNLVAPCTHQGACGLLDPANSRHWCHHFASPPPEVFTDGVWAKFAHLAGIDLSSLPLSYLVLDQRKIPPLPQDAARIIGNPRITKHQASLFLCNREAVRDRSLAKRDFPAAYREIKRGNTPSLVQCQSDKQAIKTWQPLFREKTDEAT